MCTGGICCFEVALLEGFKNEISATLEDRCFLSFKIANHAMLCNSCEVLLDRGSGKRLSKVRGLCNFKMLSSQHTYRIRYVL